MDSYIFSGIFQSKSPPNITEEKSIHDNLILNKQNLEKGLQNRLSQGVLIDRGILRNPGKAFSDKMQQLDLAKKRDRLKKKIANRPGREELVQKLILQEQSNSRQEEVDRIKQVLDDSFRHRPGSLELVNKNILQVDRLLASRVQSGDIIYPKVCDDRSVSDNSPLPSISEKSIPTTLSELSTLASFISTKPSTSKPTQFSCKKTCRVGKFSFHNIEFYPSQKVREFQQNQLIQFQEMQDQRNPNMKKLHSELRSKKFIDSMKHDKSYSLLHRLNVHELKTECKMRMIPCSNIPKAQLVERLLPYESEILASHTSFDCTGRTLLNSSVNTDDSGSFSQTPSVSEFSPEQSVDSSNLYSPYPTGMASSQIFNIHSQNRMIHSLSEPIIINYLGGSQNNINVADFHSYSLVSNNPGQKSNRINDVNNSQQISVSYDANNSYPSLHYHNADGYSFDTPLASDNVMYRSQPQVPYYNKDFEGVLLSPSHVQVSKPVILSQESASYFNNEFDSVFLDQSQLHLTKPTDIVSPESTFNNVLHHSSNGPMFVLQNSALDTNIPMSIVVPELPKQCEERFNVIWQKIKLIMEIVDRANLLRQSSYHLATPGVYILPRFLMDSYQHNCSHLRDLIAEMFNFIKMELKFERIDESMALIEEKWLTDLLNLIKNNFSSENCIKMEKTQNNMSADIPNGDIHYESNGFDVKADLQDFDPMDYLESLEVRNSQQNFHEPNHENSKEMNGVIFDLNDLSLPTTPNWPDISGPTMCSGDIDEFMDDLLKS